MFALKIARMVLLGAGATYAVTLMFAIFRVGDPLLLLGIGWCSTLALALSAAVSVILQGLVYLRKR